MQDAAVDAAEMARLREQVEQLQTALASRVVIEQAKGVLAERLHIDVTEAFALLRYSARTAQMPLHDLAQQVVESRATPSPVVIGVSRSQRWRAAAERERAEASRALPAELRERIRRRDRYAPEPSPTGQATPVPPSPQ